MARIPRGHTLVEMLIALSIVAVVAGVAARGLSSSDAGQLDAAAEDVAGALRFARTEAMRTRTWHGVDFSIPSGDERRIRLFRVPSGTGTPAFDVRHPVSKSAFDIALSTQPGTGTVTLGPASFHYRTGSATTVTREWVAFDERGTPDYYPDADGYAAYGDAVRINSVLLTQAGRTRQVLLDPVTGRVSTR